MGSLPGQFHLRGEMIGSRYELVERTDYGRYGVLYRATDKSSRTVGIEVLHQELDANAVPARPSDMLKVRHPRIASVLDVGAHGPFLFVVREWSDGYYLCDEVEHGAVSTERGLTILAAVCEGLAALHDRGQIHGCVNAQCIAIGMPVSASAPAGPEVKLTELAVPGWTTHEVVTPAQEVAAAVEVGRVLLGVDQQSVPWAVERLLANPTRPARELAAACAACLEVLSPEERAAIRMRPPPQLPPPLSTTPEPPAPWSPPSSRSSFCYAPAGADPASSTR